MSIDDKLQTLYDIASGYSYTIRYDGSWHIRNNATYDGIVSDLYSNAKKWLIKDIEKGAK